MKYLHTIAFVVVALFPGVAQSRQADKTIIVEAPQVTFGGWSRQVTKNIEKNLFFPSSVNGVRSSGMVSVAFQCSDNGRPSVISVARKSGDVGFDRAAVFAVRHIKSLHPMPTSLAPGQKFVANIMFATDQNEYNRLLDAMRKDAALHNARLSGNGQAIVLDIGSHVGAATGSGS